MLRHAYVQKYVPLLHGYGFTVPDDGLHQDAETGEWMMSEIDWAPLRATLSNSGPDSERRLANAVRNHAESAWFRESIGVSA